MPTNTAHRDDTIITQVLAGQRDNFGVLVERYLPMVQAIAYARVQSNSDIDDVAQETFLKAFQNLDQLRERAKFPAWLARIARNAATAILKQRGRDAALPSEPHAEAPDFARRELRLAIREHIEKLDTDAREVVLLHYFAGASGREIAKIIDASEPAVRKRLQRAREALGEQLLTTFERDDALAALRSESAKRILTAVLAAGATWSRVSGAATAATSATTLTGALTVGKFAAFAAFVALAAGVILISGEEVPTPEIISDNTASEISTPTPLDESVPNDSPQLARVEGVALLGGSGDPVVGVAIQLRRESDGEFVEPPAISGADGVFRFEGLTSGGYTLVAEHESLVSERQLHSFEVAEEGKAHWIEVVMLEGGAISGRVYDASTLEGIEGARIEMKYHMGPSATTDVNGYYILTGVPAGEARVFREFVQDYTRRKDEARGILAEVTPGQTTEGVDFPLMKGVLALIQGRVLDEAGAPVSGVRVWALDEKDPFNRTSNSATTDADGAFTLDGFEISGSIFLVARSEGATSDNVGPLTLTADGIKGLEVVLRPTGSLSGHVIDLDGNPVADSSIRVGATYTRMGHIAAAGEGALDENGAFTIENLSERSYGLFINLFTGRSFKPLLTVDLAAGEHLTGIELPFDYAKYLEIKAVRAAAPTPTPRRAEEPPRVEVKIRIVHSDTNEPVGRSRIRGQYSGASKNDSFDSFADTEGRFSVRPRHGDAVELLAEATGFAPGHAEFSVDENGRVSGGDIVIRLQPGAAVDGSVVDEQGTPVIGASVYVNFDPTLHDGFGWDPSSDRATVTDGEGSFYLDSLNSEPTTFYVEHPSFAQGTVDVIPTRTQPSSVQIVMNSGGVIEGSVWWNGAPRSGMRLGLLNANDALVDTGSIVTDADGRYRIYHLSPGEYAVQTSIMADYRWMQRRLAVVSEGSTTQLDFFSPAVPGILEGMVLVDGIIPEYMGLQLEIETDYGSELVSNMDLIKTGNFLVENLPSGWATLSVTAIDANHEPVKATEEFQIGEGATLRMDFDL